MPDPFDATGSYNQPRLVRTKTVAFVTFAHAEVEAYFEDRVIEIAISAKKALENDWHVSRPILSLVTFTEISSDGVPTAFKPQQPTHLTPWLEKFEIRQRASRVIDAFIRNIKVNNHGIKEKDLAGMLIPVGISYDKVDPLLITDLNDFGSTRGMFVHTSKNAYVTVGLDPRTEFDRVTKLVKDIQPVDEELDRLLSESRP